MASVSSTQTRIDHAMWQNKPRLVSRMAMRPNNNHHRRRRHHHHFIRQRQHTAIARCDRCEKVNKAQLSTYSDPPNTAYIQFITLVQIRREKQTKTHIRRLQKLGPTKSTILEETLKIKTSNYTQ